MPVIFRIELNPSNQKELVASRGVNGRRSIQIWKGFELIDILYEEEIRDLWSRADLADLVSQHFQCGRVGTAHVRLHSHLVHFSLFRDKAFILFERDDTFTEVDGMPRFKQTYLGRTAWNAICEHKEQLLDFIA